jgi:hypothetical protein
MLGESMESEMPQYHVFQGTTGTQVAITDDPTGAKLPRRQTGGWYPMKTLSVEPGGGPLIAADSDDIIAAVAKDGYYLYPPPKS